jgi:hypothetical protein
MPTPLEVAESSIVAPIIFSVFVTTNTALLHTKDPWEDLKGAKHDGIRGKLSNPFGNALISISARYTLSMPRSSRDCTYYVISRSLQSPVFEPT